MSFNYYNLRSGSEIIMGTKFSRSAGYSEGIREVFEGIRYGFQGIRVFGPSANTANTRLCALPDPDQLPFL